MKNMCYKVFGLLGLVTIIISLRLCSCQDKQSPRFKFLMYPAADDGSHHLYMMNVAKSLTKQGHSVTFLLSSSCTKWLNGSDANLFDFIVYKSSFTSGERQEISRQFTANVINGKLRSFVGFLNMLYNPLLDNEQKRVINFGFEECKSLLGDKTTIQEILDIGFDMFIGDDLTWCNPLLAHKLDLRFVLYSSSPMRPAKQSLIYGLPNHPAYIPERQLGLSDNMTFGQRLLNTFMSVVYKVLFSVSLFQYSWLQTTHDIAPENSMVELTARAELWIINMDFTLDFPRSLPPNVILTLPTVIGSTHDPKVSLDQQEVVEFVDNASKEGVILFSLGTHMDHIGEHLAGIFARGLARLQQKVLWHFRGKVSSLPLGNNTKVVTWIPMQSLMAHPNVRAVLCHGGNGIVHEAAWYGLPIVGIPLFGDHFDNMLRVSKKGFGIGLDFFKVTEESLYQAVTRVIQEPSFRKNAQRLSNILRDDLVAPADKAAHWITHVTKFGGDYLRPKILDMNFLQSSMIDVYGFMLCLSLAFMLMARKLCLCSCRYLYRRLHGVTEIQKMKQK